MRAETGLVSLLRRTLAKAIDFFRLTKPKLLSLVLFTTFVGFYAGVRGPLPLELLLHTLIGTALMAGGTTALNMYRERDLDALMQRTALRPLATGRMPSSQALIFALAISSGGFIYLFLFVNPLASLLSAIIFASYIFLYTPLKTRTWLSIFVGAVPGALPVILGWTAANASISLGACILFLIVFFWQIPHFFAIGWLHRDDYLRASLRVMPAIDRDGRKTSRLTLGFIVALLILSLVPFFAGLAGPVYVGGAVLLGMIFLAYAIHFARRRDALAARRLFVASAFYLPLLLVLLTLSKTSL
ncbi:MAG: heme o synthase [Acidobacteriota bacterium]|nr:heme o synthase [Acidobacteriota bacterium]